jgi:CHAD domain-containing protein
MVGGLRDVDLFIERSMSLRDEAKLRARLEAVRAQRRLDATATLTGVDFGAFTVALFRAAWLEDWRGGARKRLETPAAGFAVATLAGLFGKTLEVGAAVDFCDPPTLHPLRLELKRFRYAAQFFRDFYAAEARAPFFASMSALQTALGTVNDAVVAARIADAVGEGLGPDAMRAAGFIAGCRSAEALAAARAAETTWAALVAAPRFWEGATSTDEP